MRRALLLAAVLVSGASVAASANPVPPVPVHVYRDGNGSVCVAVSLQVPQCTPAVTITK
jgi:hypothetical protein